MVIQGIVFDIDDTLYLERDYVRSGFRAVARHAARSDKEAEQLFAWLWNAFKRGVRGDTFDRLRSAFPEIAAAATTSAMVEVYRTHQPTIGLLPGVADLVDRLSRAGLRIGALSDGPAASQGAKARALGLARWCDPIVLTDELAPWAAKPSPVGFEMIARRWGLHGPDLCYVANDPSKDFIGPRGLGWLSIRLRLRGQLQPVLEPADPGSGPDAEVASIAELRGCLGVGDREGPRLDGAQAQP